MIKEIKLEGEEMVQVNVTNFFYKSPYLQKKYKYLTP